MENPRGPKPGDGLVPREAADELVIARIQPEHLRLESLFYKSKWYDYRRLHPLAATRLFASVYDREYRRAQSTYFDANRPVVGLAGDFMEKQERNTLWRLRQQADQLGIRYGIYARAAIAWYVESIDARLPRPNHLLHGSIGSATYDSWVVTCRDRLQIPTDPFYRADAFIGHPYQIECEQWLLAQANVRVNAQYSLASLVYIHRCVRPEALPPAWGGRLDELKSLADEISNP